LNKPEHLRSSDLHGLGRVAVDAVLGVSELVEALHLTIGQRLSPLAPAASGRTRGLTGLVYQSFRGVTRAVGGGLDLMLGQLPPMLARKSNRDGNDSSLSSNEREAVLAALNGVLGDHLAASKNPLAIRMQFRHLGIDLPTGQARLAERLPESSGKILVLVHGLCMNDRQWNANQRDPGIILARELGFTPVYLYYNSGLHISTNGDAFSALLERLVKQWPQPVAELAIIAHSMGGLVARSACASADRNQLSWRGKLRKLVFLGTPHHGAPLERGGNWIDLILGISPYSAPFARLGKVRSAGITDLRHGNLSEIDWQGRDRFARSAPAPQPVALPAGVACHFVAATRSRKSADGKAGSDGLVPVASALGQHDDPSRCLEVPKTRQFIARGLNHFDLLDHSKVRQKISRWLQA
jgi:pimeloyl-ACP methyl ester carboxylesterase